MTLLYVIRHGETDYNRNGRYQGQSDVPLNAEGRSQCRALTARMSAIPLDVVYTSDLSRAQECARMIAGARTVLLDTRLREVNVGRCTGLTVAEIAAREPAFYVSLKTDPDSTPFPGGESAHDLLGVTDGSRRGELDDLHAGPVPHLPVRGCKPAGE